jgi:hypothetical protein
MVIIDTYRLYPSINSSTYEFICISLCLSLPMSHFLFSQLFIG